MDQTGGRLEACQEMNGPDRWQSRDLTGNEWTRQVVEKRPVRQCIRPDRWQSRDLSDNA